MKIRPEFTSSNPANIRNVVDFPHPDGPTRTMNSPSPISRSIPGTAGLSEPGYHRCAFSKVTVAIGQSSLALDAAREALDELLLGEDVEGEDRDHRDEHDREDEVPLRDQRADVVIHDDRQ